MAGKTIWHGPDDEEMRFLPVFLKTTLLGGAVGGGYGGLVGTLFGLGSLIVSFILWPEAPEAGSPAIIIFEGAVGLIIGLIGGLAVGLPAGFVIGLEAAFVKNPTSVTFRSLAALQVGVGCLWLLPRQLFDYSENGGGGLIGDGPLDALFQLSLFNLVPALLAGTFLYNRLPSMLGEPSQRSDRADATEGIHAAA